MPHRIGWAVTETLLRLDEAGDAELISAVRGGDLSAYGALFERHVDAARRLARQLTSPSDADDLVSDAFAKVLRVLQRGGGPDVAFRAYLLTAVRRLHVDRIRATSRLHTTDDMEAFDSGVPFRDTAVEGFENAAAAKAFASLPERWQLVLWHTEVEGQKPADVAVLLGMSANSVSALAYRAREGLRQAFLNSHAEDLDDAQCRWTHEHLGAYIRKGASRRDAAKVEKHLDDCRGCMGVYLELVEVNSNLSGILAPLLLGAAASGYLASAGGVAKGGALLALLDRSKEVVAAHTQAVAVGGVVAATTVLGVTAVVVGGGDDGRVTDPTAGVVAPAPADEAVPGDDADDDERLERAPRPVVQRGTTDPGPDGEAPADEGAQADAATEETADGPAEEPADEQQSTEPGQDPADQPGTGPGQTPGTPPADGPGGTGSTGGTGSPGGGGTGGGDTGGNTGGNTGGDPGSGSGGQPGGGDGGSTPPPPPPPPPPPAADLSLDVAFVPGRPQSTVSSARVQGFTAGGTARITISTTGLTFTRRPAGCTLAVDLAERPEFVYHCAVTTGRPGIGPFTVNSLALGRGGSLEISVQATGGTEDANAGNNTWRHTF